MRILTYKRTHTGDPGFDGCFGNHGCMGRVRDFHFDAVIGVGGMGAEARSWDIAGKLTWIGVGPQRGPRSIVDGASVVTFERFFRWDARGPDLRLVAPSLASRMYDGRVRYLLDGYAEAERADALALIQRDWDLPIAHDALDIPQECVDDCNHGCPIIVAPCTRASCGEILMRTHGDRDQAQPLRKGSCNPCSPKC